MSKETMFYQLCNIMAELDDVINDFEKMGFTVEPGEKNTVTYKFYHSASMAYEVASSLLEFPNVKTENDVFNALLTANLDTMDMVSKEVWEKYGIK